MATIVRYCAQYPLILPNVAAFLVLGEFGQLLWVLRKGGKDHAVSFLPTRPVIKSVITHAPPPRGIRVDAMWIGWTREQQDSQTVTMEDLRLLHFLVKNCPLHMQPSALPSHPGDLDVPAAAAASLLPYAMQATAGADSCSISAQRGPAVSQSSALEQVQVHMQMPCVECHAAGCHATVLRTCPACEHLCSACETHAAECPGCRQAVCAGCIVQREPVGQGQGQEQGHDQEQGQGQGQGQEQEQEQGQEPEAALCSACMFRCPECAALKPRSELFVCMSGADCYWTRRELCSQCAWGDEEEEIEGVVVVIHCGYCDKISCGDCRLQFFPHCDGCDDDSDPICNVCETMDTCASCQSTYHPQCSRWSNGNGIRYMHTCTVCKVNLCHECDPMQDCSFGEYPDGHATLCRGCVADNAFVCPAGHVACLDCQLKWIECLGQKCEEDEHIECEAGDVQGVQDVRKARRLKKYLPPDTDETLRVRTCWHCYMETRHGTCDCMELRRQNYRLLCLIKDDDDDEDEEDEDKKKEEGAVA